MPHNNRVSASTALRTNDIWSKTIGYNPYAAEGEKSKDDDNQQSVHTAGLLLLAKARFFKFFIFMEKFLFIHLIHSLDVKFRHS